MAQLGSALAWGARGRKFKSCRPDQDTVKARYSRFFCYKKIKLALDNIECQYYTISERSESMLTIKNRLRILGSDEEILEIKAFLDPGKKDDSKGLDFKKVMKDFKGDIKDIEIGYDIIHFTSSEPMLDVIKSLSKRFEDVKFALQAYAEKRVEKDGLILSEVEKSHHVIYHGDIINQSQTTSKHIESLKKDQALLEEKNAKDAKNELVSRESLFDLQDKFFKDIQAFMKDFTESFFKHWF